MWVVKLRSISVLQSILMIKNIDWIFPGFPPPLSWKLLTSLYPPWSKHKPGSCPWGLRMRTPLTCTVLVLKCHKVFSQENSIITESLRYEFLSSSKLLSDKACHPFLSQLLQPFCMPGISSLLRQYFCDQKNCLHHMSVKCNIWIEKLRFYIRHRHFHSIFIRKCCEELY